MTTFIATRSWYFNLVHHRAPHASDKRSQRGQGTNGASVSAAKPEESEEDLLNSMMLAHYGARSDVLPWDMGPSAALAFPARAAKLLQKSAIDLGVPLDRSLDLGCAVGRSSFDLAMAFKEVCGIDMNRRFIEAANELKADGQRIYVRQDGGSITADIVASIDNIVDRTRVAFHVDDACSLSPQIYGNFNAVLVANVLEYVEEPRQVVARTAGGSPETSPSSPSHLFFRFRV